AFGRDDIAQRQVGAEYGTCEGQIDLELHFERSGAGPVEPAAAGDGRPELLGVIGRRPNRPARGRTAPASAKLELELPSCPSAAEFWRHKAFCVRLFRTIWTK